MNKIIEEFNLYGKHYKIETGELAKQASGSVLVSQADTTVLVTTVVSTEEKNYDFFPLTVDFIEKMYAVGRIPGGYLRREAKPSDKATLFARTIDRPIRTGFPDGFKQEVHIVATSLVCDGQNPPDTISVNGASAALMVAGAPFEGPAACVRIGRNIESGEFIVNPTYTEEKNSDLELTVAGTKDYISMVEAGAKEVSEDDMLSAMEFAQKVIGEFCDAQQRFIDKVDPCQMEYQIHQVDSKVEDIVQAHKNDMDACVNDIDVASRIVKIANLKDLIKKEFTEEEQEQWASDIDAELKNLEKHSMREMVIKTKRRIDGREITEIRPLHIVGDYLPRVHGSGLFQRGQTQALSIATLGMLSDAQRLDTIDPQTEKRYMHHYNFPPYCTGQVGRMGSPKRREIGHGDLAERALIPVLPSEDEFPYSIRVVSEILESNGSSSMASTCGSTLSLMDAGVPIKRPVSGIAMGLIKEEEDVVILSDIQGLEDFLGDMDFKVCGTEKGITALQMDNKAKGLSLDILSAALKQAKVGRAFILNAMLDAVPKVREDFKEFTPKIETIKINTDKIKDVIGKGGDTIRDIQEKNNVEIEILDDGTTRIFSCNKKSSDNAIKIINSIVKDPEIGEQYSGEVVGIKDFGAFIKLTPTKDGLLHISKIAKGRIGRVEDVLNIGDKIDVVITDIDRGGKISLDRLNKPEIPQSNKSYVSSYYDENSSSKKHSGYEGYNKRRR